MTKPDYKIIPTTEFERIVREKFETAEKGLLNLHQQTGQGKTYSVNRAILSYFLSHKTDGNRIFIITNSNKNVDSIYNSLQKLFEEHEMLKWFDENALRIKNQIETIKDNLTNKDYLNIIPQDVKREKIFNSLLERIEDYKRIESKEFAKNYSKKFIIETQKEQENKIYNNFKELLKQQSQKFKIQAKVKIEIYIKTLSQEQLNEINLEDEILKLKRELMKEPQWKWIKSLRPDAQISDKKIICITDVKFIYPTDAFYKASTFYYSDAEFIQNSIILIDETDKVYTDWLSHLSKVGAEQSLKLIEAFSSTKNHMLNKSLPKEFDLNQRTKEKFEKLRNTISETSNKYHFDKNYIFDETKEENNSKRSKMFFEASSFIINDSNNEAEPFIKVDFEKYNNQLTNTKEKPNPNTFMDLIMETKRNIKAIYNFFEICDYQLQKKTQSAQSDNKDIKSDIKETDYTERRNKIESLASQFFINNEPHEITRQSILNYISRSEKFSQKKANKNIEKLMPESVAKNGYNITVITNNNEKDRYKSSIMQYNVDFTPEKILCLLAQEACVISYSATGCIKNSLGNFDLEFLKYTLGNKYNTFSEESIQKIKEEKTDLEKELEEKICFQAEIVPYMAQPYSLSSWKCFFKNNEDETIIKDIFTEYNITNELDKKRIFTIAKLAEKFFNEPHTHSFLIYSNKLLLSDKNTKNAIIEILKNTLKVKIDFDKCIRNLETRNFKENLENIKDYLFKGGKCMIFTTYSTLSTGYNLTYPIPENLKNEVVKTNNREKNITQPKKDIDWVYVEKPTFILDNGYNIDDDYEFQNSNYRIQDVAGIKTIGHFGFSASQAAKLVDFGDWSQRDATKFIKELWDNYLMNQTILQKNDDTTTTRTYNHKEIEKCKGFKLKASVIILQALGRICRTAHKNINRRILVDENIDGIFEFDLIRNDDCLIPLEVEKAIKKLQENYKNNLTDSDKIYQYDNKSKIIQKKKRQYITSAFRIEKDISKEQIKYIDKIYEFVLRTGLMTNEINLQTEKDQELLSFFGQAYIKFNNPADCYYYQNIIKEKAEKNIRNFGEVKIYLSEYDCSNNKNLQKVSYETVRLKQLLKIKPVKEYFEDKGYSTSTEPGKYILRPGALYQYYYGPLGETAGNVILNEYFGIQTEHIIDPEIYEQFDYKIKETNIFIDYKHWHDVTLQSDLLNINNVLKKANKVKADAVVICNIFCEDDTQMKSEPITYKKRYKFSEDSCLDKDVIIYSVAGLFKTKPNLQPNLKAFNLIKTLKEDFSL